MRVIVAPDPIPQKKSGDRMIFLAGSIEQGRAEDWQQEALQLLSETDWTVFNPRRMNWDSSWVQDKTNAQFRTQVEWELAALESSDMILMYLDPNTKSPVSLLELGLFAHTHKIVVVCPEGFWRKGNVDIVCERYGIQQADTIEKAVRIFKK